MDYYKADEIKQRRRENTGKKKRIILASMATALILFILGSGLMLYLAGGKEMLCSPYRIKNMLLFTFLGRGPQFYHLDLEKNGNEERLREDSELTVTYRDEFVVKDVSTDSLFNRGITVDVGGMGKGDDFRVMLKGVVLIDRAIRASGGDPRKLLADYRVHIKYHDTVIAAIPIRLEITPQDWLRLAKGTENHNLQIAYLEKAAASNKDDHAARKLLASAYLQAGRYDNAISEYETIRKQKADDPAVSADLAKAYLEKKEYAKALSLAGEAARLNPKDVSAHAIMAIIYGKMGKWDSAVKQYQEAAKLNPDDSVLMFALGDAYEKTGNIRNAIGEYERALKKKPGDKQIQAALSNAQTKAADPDKAIQIYKEVVRKQPKDGAAYARLAEAYGKKGRLKEEIENYKKAGLLKPKDPIIHYNLALAYEKANRLKEAVNEYEKVLALRPDDPDALSKLARLGGKDPQLKTRLASVREKSGRLKDAVQQEEKSPEIKPDMAALNKLTEQYLKKKDYNAAIKVNRKKIAKDTKSGGAYSNMGYIYYLKGDTKKAIEYYMTALRYSKSDDVLFARLGEAYEKKGMLKESLDAYEKAYKINAESDAAEKIPKLKIKIIQKKYQEQGAESDARGQNP